MATTSNLPEPTRVAPQENRAPNSNWLVRGLSAVLRGRMPHQARGAIDKLLKSLGIRYRIMHVDDIAIVVRRGASWDVNAVRRIVEERDYAKYGHEIRETDVVIDIGANIGCFALVAGKAAARGRVYAFEPDSENFDMTRRSVRLNGLSNVTVERCAVAGESGSLKLYHGAHGPLHSVVPGRLGEAEAVDEVPAVTLPQIMDKYAIERCGFLKMNCEGAEYGILYNTPADYLKRIDRISLEYHASADQDKSTISRELAGFLCDQGFDLVEFTDFVGFDCGYIRGTRPA